MTLTRFAVLLAGLCFAAVALAGDLPDLNKTPGAIRAGLTKKRICEIKWGKDARHVTAKMKREGLRALWLHGQQGSAMRAGQARPALREVDHLISRKLGGADEAKNLWPEAYGTKPWNAALKDKLENRLHKEMCAGHITLKQARNMLVNDWRVAYREYYGEPK